MSGAVFQGQFRAGVEVTYGTGVAPTRRLYFAPGSGLVPGGSTTRNAVQTGTRAQIRSASPGASAPGGSFSLPVEAGEILEILECGVNGTPTITTPATGTNARHHVYVGGGTLDSMTLQWHDGFRPWQEVGVYVNTARIAGSAGGDNTLSGDFFGSAITQTALSGSVTDRAPTPYGGWEAALAIDSVDGTDNYGSTVIAAGQSVVNWDLPLCENNLGRLYTAANTRAMQAAVMGLFEATGSVSFVAKGARSLTEYNDFAAGTQKRLSMTFGNNTVIEAALKSFVTVDIPIVWTEFTLLGEEAGERTYEASFAYVYDSTNSLPLRVKAQNLRTAAFA